jgi:hypothetical protein
MRAVALWLILLLPVLPGSQAMSPGYPELRLGLFPSERIVDPVNCTRNVSFDGTVTVDNPTNGTLHVILWSYSALWTVSSTPNDFFLKDSGQERFNLTVMIPYGAFNQTIDAWVTANAYLVGQIVAINQSSKVSITVRNRSWTQEPDDSGPKIVYSKDGQAQIYQSVLGMTMILAILAVAGYGLARRRRMRGEPGP